MLNLSRDHLLTAEQQRLKSVPSEIFFAHLFLDKTKLGKLQTLGICGCRLPGLLSLLAFRKDITKGLQFHNNVKSTLREIQLPLHLQNTFTTNQYC